MKNPFVSFALAAGLLMAGSAFAQTAPQNDQLYKAFGEKAGLIALMDDFMVRLLADPRTGPHFKPSNQQRVKEQLVDQLCALSGGPCVYKGADMKSAHANLDIKKSDFHALVEVLQHSMDAKGIPFRRQNEMLALLVLGTSACAGNLVVSVLDRDGKPVQDAVVMVTPAGKNAAPKTPLAAQATINQEKMQFVPMVTVVPVGAKVSFVNNDPWDHHVRSSPAGMGQFNTTNAGFELRLEGKTEGKPGKSSDITLDKAGVIGATLLGCFIHGSMRGYIYASESPWAAKTSSEGVATFEDLPEGAATVKVWQADQLIDIAPQQVTVGAVLAKNVMQLTVVPRRRRS